MNAMRKIVLITRDFTLRNALSYYIDSLYTHQDMDVLTYHINKDNADLKYLFLIDNRYPFSEIVKIEEALKNRDIKACFFVIRMSKVAYNILGYSRCYQVQFEGSLIDIIPSIISFNDDDCTLFELNHFNYLDVNKFEIDMMKLSIFEENIKSVAKRMDVPVKKIYLYRELLCKRLGLPNVNQAFLYILNHYPGSNFNERL